MVVVLALTWLLFRAGGLVERAARAYRHRGADPALRHPARGARRCSSCSTGCATRPAWPERCRAIPTRWRGCSTSVLLLVFARLLRLAGGAARLGRTLRDLRGLGADLRDGGHRLRLPRRAARGAAAGGDGAGRRRHHRAPPRLGRPLPRRASRSTARPVRFMVDTGASDIVLSRRDAERVGIEPGSLSYLGRARTANGAVATAPVRLARGRVRRLHRHRRARERQRRRARRLAARHVLSRPLRHDRDRRRPDAAPALGRVPGSRPERTRQTI